MQNHAVMSDKNQADLETPYSDKELEHFKNLLLEKRHKAKEELDDLQDSADNIADVESEDQSAVTHHQGDAGSDVEEEETLYTLIERKKKHIKDIDAALGRIENGTYGVCLATGKKISKDRLEAVPHTRYSIEAKNRGLAEDQ